MKLNMSKLLLLASISIFSSLSYADYVVIANPKNQTEITKEDIRNIYLAKRKTFSNGKTVTPIHQSENFQIRKSFEENVVGMKQSELRVYWSRLLFTGKAAPIKQLESDRDVIDFVLKNINSIGYVDSENIDENVKVIFSF